jgi:arylsulfatase A-like enzyme
LLHYWDPHGPYDAPEPWRERYVPEALRGRDRLAIEQDLVRELRRGQARTPDDADVRFLVGRYLGEVAWFDAQLGKLLDHLVETGLAKTTTLILTADHGEEFYEHGIFGHGSDLYAETVHVPLLIADPAALASWGKAAPAQGSDVDAVVSTAGLCAEILGRLSVPFDPEALRPPLEQGAGWAFTETEKGQALQGIGDILRRPLRATWDDVGLLVVERALPDAGLEQRTVFYDLRADPRAQVPLPPDGPAAQVLLQRLEEATRWAEAHRVQGPAAGGDQALLEQLRALGYVGEPDPSRDDH